MVMVTLSLWGVLPIFLKVALNQFSAGTIAWFRFLFSFIVLCKFQNFQFFFLLLRFPLLLLLQLLVLY